MGLNKVSGPVGRVEDLHHLLEILTNTTTATTDTISILDQSPAQLLLPSYVAYVPSHKMQLLADSPLDCVILKLSQQLKIHIGAPLCMCVCARGGERETGVIELRGFSVFGGRGEIGIFRIH